MTDFFDFEESDIVFSDDSSSDSSSSDDQVSRQDYSSNSRSFRRRSTISKRRKQEKCSVPVNIPANSNSSSPSSSPRYDAMDFGGHFFDDEGEIIPPHVIVDRRSSGFDSYEKNARVKNLFHVRNSILKLTGFLES